MKNILSLRQSQTLYKVMERKMKSAGLARDWVHGPLHVKRVLQDLELLLVFCAVDRKMADNLRIAVILHDIGRGGKGNHAEEGSKFFDGMKIEWRDGKDREDISFAIANHNKGLEELHIRKAKEDRHKLLGYLCLLDQMDALGIIGYYRVLEWYGARGEKFSLLGDVPAKDLRNIMDGKISANKVRQMNLKGRNAVLPHAVFDLWLTDRVVAPVKHMLDRKFLEEIEKRKRELRGEMEGVIGMKEEMERSKDGYKISLK